jgi:hypothetical protein
MRDSKQKSLYKHGSDFERLKRYRVIKEESVILWEIIVCVILSKKVHINMGRILNGYQDTG